MKGLKNLLSEEEANVDLHNKIRWLIEDYVGEFELKIELIDKIIEKIKEKDSIENIKQLERDELKFIKATWVKNIIK